MPLRKFLGELQTRRCVGDDVALELQVLRSLGKSLRAGNGEPRLHARQAAKPGELHLVVGEGGDGSGIALDRKIFDRNAELAFEILGVLA